MKLLWTYKEKFNSLRNEKYHSVTFSTSLDTEFSKNVKTSSRLDSSGISLNLTLVVSDSSLKEESSEHYSSHSDLFGGSSDKDLECIMQSKPNLDHFQKSII